MYRASKAKICWEMFILSFYCNQLFWLLVSAAIFDHMNNNAYRTSCMYILKTPEVSRAHSNQRWLSSLLLQKKRLYLMSISIHLFYKRPRTMLVCIFDLIRSNLFLIDNHSQKELIFLRKKKRTLWRFCKIPCKLI